MSETFSVKAILSAESTNFNSVFGGAVSTLASFDKLTGGLTGSLGNVTNMVKSGLGFGILQGIGQKAFSIVSQGVSNLTNNLGGAISRYDTLKQFPKTMELMGFKTEQTEAATNKLVAAIDGLPTSLDGITANTQSIALITGDLDGATDTAIALNNAFLMSGSSTAAAERGLTQYVQMMSAGKVDMQSWRTLLETMSPALNKVAESFGYTGESAKNDLYAALQSGEISFNDFNRRLVEMNNGMDISGEHFEGFAKLAKTSSEGIQTSMQNVKTAVIKNLANMIEETDKKLQESGNSIKGYFDGLKQGINDTFKAIQNSVVFTHLIESAQTTITAITTAFNKFTQSAAMKAVHDNLDRIAQNIGVILPNVIKALEPIMEAAAKVATGILAAISDVIAKVTSNKAFLTFCENIGKAVEKVGALVEKVIRGLTPYFTAVLNAANEVMSAFGKAFDAITKSARETDTAGKLYDNFSKVLGFVKDALIKVAGFLEKHHTWILKIIEHLPQIVALIIGVKGALLILEKVQAFKALIDQVVKFGESLKNSASNIGSFVTNLVSKFKGGTDGAATQLTSLSGRADTAWMNISSGAATAGNSITTGIGGAFSKIASSVGGALGKVVSGVGSVASTIAGIAGPIAAVAGPAVMAVMGIVSAIKKWQEEQYKAGKAMAELSEEERALIDKNKELTDSYEQLKKSSLEKISDFEAEAEYARALRDEYNKLLDTNGLVIEGKEKQAQAIQGRLFEALGIETTRITDLQSEYRDLLDSNGDVISGYADRAAEIRGELSDAMGYEISNTQEVMDIQNKLMSNIDNIIDKKRLEAEASVLTDAYVEAEKKKHELHTEEMEIMDLLQEKQAEYTQFLSEHNATRAEDLSRLSKKEQGYFDGLTEDLEEINKELDKNARAQEQCEKDKQLSMEATAAVGEENYGRLSVIMDQYNGDLITAKDAVKEYSENAQSQLTQQAENAEANYQRIKEAYENGEKWATETAMTEAEARRDFAKEQLENIYNDTSLHYEQRLQNQLKADQEEYEEARANYERIRKMSDEERRRQTDSNLSAAKERFENARQAYQDSENAYKSYMDNLNSTGTEKLTQLNNTTNTLTAQASDNMTRNAKAGADGVLNSYTPLSAQLPGLFTRTMAESNSALSTGGASAAAIAGTASASVHAAFQSGASKVPGTFTTAMSASTTAILNKKEAMRAASASVEQGVENEMTKMQSALPASAGNALTATGNTIRASGVALEIITVRDRMANYMNYLTEQFRQSANNAMIGLQNGIYGRAAYVYSAAREVANGVVEIINSALQVHSPSRLMVFTGRMIDEGLITGIQKDAGKLDRVAQGIAQQTAENINKVNNLIAMPDLSEASRGLSRMTANANFELNSDYDYSHNAHVVSEIHLEMDKRTISRVTVDTDSEEQYFNQKRYYR